MRYLALSWPSGEPSAAAARYLEAIAPEWTTAAGESGWAVLRPRDAHLEVHRLPNGRGVVIGELHDRGAAEQGRLSAFPLRRLDHDAGASEIAEALAIGAWGRYVALFRDPRGEPAVLRDPTGGIEAVFWSRGDVDFIASELPMSEALWPDDLQIDAGDLGRFLLDRDMLADICPLGGVQVLAPGTLRWGRGLQRQEVVWSPGRFARRGDWRADAEYRLRNAMDVSCLSVASKGGAFLCEVSGGLDSAIVTTSMARTGAAISAVNMAWSAPEADERPFAREVAARSGARLTEFERDLTVFDAITLEETAGGARPGLNAIDPTHDELIKQAAVNAGARGIITGQGGDGLFFQMPAGDLASDIVRRGAGPRGRIAALADLSSRTRRSFWSLAAEALPRPHGPWKRHPSSFLIGDPDPDSVHPWLSAEGVSKAKQLQIRMLIHNRKVVGPSRRGQVAELVHPLLCQPLIELCLSLPAPQLASGRIDRHLARQAFAERLPASVVRRRSKGDVTAFFPRSLLASLGFVRDYLLSGELAAMDLLDRGRLEALLEPQRMVHECPAGEIITALHAEAWARVWRHRLSRRGGDRAHPI